LLLFATQEETLKETTDTQHEFAHERPRGARILVREGNEMRRKGQRGEREEGIDK